MMVMLEKSFEEPLVMLKKLRELVKFFFLRNFQLAAEADTMNGILQFFRLQDVLQLLSALYRMYISIYADNVRKTQWFMYSEVSFTHFVLKN